MQNCNSDACEIIFSQLFPALGVVVANALFLSPLPAILNASKRQKLGAINPVPFPLIFVNCVTWLQYSLVVKDYYLFFANYFAIPLSLYYTITCLSLGTLEVAQAEQEDQKSLAQMARLVRWSKYIGVVGLLVIQIGTMLSFITFTDQSTRQQIMGGFCIGILVLFYVSPLSTFYHVIKTNNSESFYWPLSLMTFLNGALWVFYGSFIGDAFIWAPNVIGAIMGIIQLVCIFLYPKRLVRLDSDIQIQIQ
jgi:solute carrier family 50 protein (sugar transporter)